MFVFQEPGGSDLLDEINSAAQNAERGGGVFAFASKGGIDKLLRAPNVQVMLNEGRPLDLIVGVDSITNADALAFLSDQIDKFGELTAKAFYHQYPGSTFHPKFSWFYSRGKLQLLTGSGNLTKRGLGQSSGAPRPPGNWEAFAVQSLVGDEASSVLEAIEDWVQLHTEEGRIRPLDDESVMKRSMDNERTKFIKLVPLETEDVAGGEQEEPEVAAGAVVEVGTPDEGCDAGLPEILVRELSRTRPGQADVGKSTLEDFFGYTGASRHIYSQRVLLDNGLGSVKKRDLHSNTSGNYHVEMGRPNDVPYDVAGDDGRMILVASRLGERSFRYTIVPTTSPQYPAVSGLLAHLSMYPKKRREMRKRTMSFQELLAAWEDVPSNLVPMEVPAYEI